MHCANWAFKVLYTLSLDQLKVAKCVAPEPVPVYTAVFIAAGLLILVELVDMLLGGASFPGPPLQFSSSFTN